MVLTVEIYRRINTSSAYLFRFVNAVSSCSLSEKSEHKNTVTFSVVRLSVVTVATDLSWCSWGEKSNAC